MAFVYERESKSRVLGFRSSLGALYLLLLRYQTTSVECGGCHRKAASEIEFFEYNH